MTKFIQGKYVVKNPEKYIGDSNNVIYRSSWERSVFNYLDTHPSVLKWNSEELVVPYVSPVDKRIHRYFVDIVAVIKDRFGNVKKYIIEIKPKAQTKPPVKPKRITKRYLNEIATYSINIEKWKSATEFARKNNCEFKILTEDDIGGII